MLVLENIIPSYIDASEVVNSDIFLQEKVIFEKNKMYLIKAESGRGKSSLLNIIYALNNDFKGSIMFNNLPLDEKQNRINTMSYVFQDLKLFDDLSLLENIELKNSLSRHKTEKEIDILIAKVGLNSKKNTLIKYLSQGQKQRLAILRALCQPYSVLLLDEPFSHLDKRNVDILIPIIFEDIQKNNACMIMVSLGPSYEIAFDKVFSL